MTRISISFSILLSLALSLAQAAEKKTKTQDTAPKVGVKTPGVQIPFASLKAEAEFEAPAKPDWVFFATSVYAPAKDSIEKIDPKTNKKGRPGHRLDQTLWRHDVRFRQSLGSDLRHIVSRSKSTQKHSR